MVVQVQVCSRKALANPGLYSTMRYDGELTSVDEVIDAMLPGKGAKVRYK